MTRNVRLSKELANKIRDAARGLNQAELPADAATAQELLLELHDALNNLREPLRALLDVATAGGDEGLREVPASAERRLRQLPPTCSTPRRRIEPAPRRYRPAWRSTYGPAQRRR
jgi:hypothetical protein